MATKKAKAVKTEKAAPKAKATAAAKSKKSESSEEKAAKRAARMEELKNRPDGQRPNSKTIDVIPMENGSRVEVYAQPVRKFGVIITAVTIDAEGNVVSTSITTLAGYRVKAKKGHGNLIVGAPGIGKASKDVQDSEDDEDGDED